MLSLRLSTHFPSFFSRTVHVRATLSCLCADRTSSQSFERVVEKDRCVIGGNFRLEIGTDREVAFFAIGPWDSSKLLESRTTEVHRRLRSREAVRSCLPSSP